MNTRKKGTRYEEQAGVFLNANDIRDITYNYRTRYGEIDIVGFDGDVLVFLRSNTDGLPKRGSRPRRLMRASVTGYAEYPITI